MLGGFEGHADDISVEVVRDAGHFIVDEHPDLVLERIRDFMG
jgi:pimeloyl-ACP methyl ester carboxylesterase